MGNINLTPGLEKRAANYVPLTPLDFLRRAAAVYPNKVGIVHGERRLSWRAVYDRARALASGLERMGVGYGEVVSILSPNTPAMIEAHFGVPGAGAVLNTINFRLDATTIAYILGHAEAKVLLVDTAFAEVAKAALAQLGSKPRVVEIDDLGTGPAGIGETEYEALSRQAMPRGPSPCRMMSGTQFRSTIPAAPPAIRKASSTTIAAPI